MVGSMDVHIQNHVGSENLIRYPSKSGAHLLILVVIITQVALKGNSKSALNNERVDLTTYTTIRNARKWSRDLQHAHLLKNLSDILKSRVQQFVFCHWYHICIPHREMSKAGNLVNPEFSLLCYVNQENTMHHTYILALWLILLLYKYAHTLFN